MELIQMIGTAAIVFVAHLLAVVTGFGSAVLATPFLAALIGLKTTVAVLVVLGTVLSLWVVARSWRSVEREPLQRALIMGALGLIPGMALFGFLPETTLKILLGVFTLAVGAHGLRGGQSEVVLSPRASNVVLFCGGVVHGALALGGPLMILYFAQVVKEKTAFRATLSCLWIVLNTLLMARWTLTQSWPPETWRWVLLLSPFLGGGLLAGEWLHNRINEKTFRVALYATLALTGVFTILLAGGQKEST